MNKVIQKGFNQLFRSNMLRYMDEKRLQAGYQFGKEQDGWETVFMCNAYWKFGGYYFKGVKYLKRSGFNCR